MTIDFPKVCRQASCHKIWAYLQFLLHPEQDRAAYYRGMSTTGKTGLVVFSEPRDKLRELERQYHWV